MSLCPPGPPVLALHATMYFVAKVCIVGFQCVFSSVDLLYIYFLSQNKMSQIRVTVEGDNKGNAVCVGGFSSKINWKTKEEDHCLGERNNTASCVATSLQFYQSNLFNQIRLWEIHLHGVGIKFLLSFCHQHKPLQSSMQLLNKDKCERLLLRVYIFLYDVKGIWLGIIVLLLEEK